MKRFFLFSSFLFLTSGLISAQEEKDSIEPYYYQIPDYPESYTPENVLARVIDGLGFRYYWATQDLRLKDLDFTPGNDNRTMGETLDHIYGLTRVVMHATTSTPNVRNSNRPELSWEETRSATLENIKQASENLKTGKAKTPEDMKMIFQRGENSSEFPLWNVLNGPLADAIYHVGQIVSYRRSSGNPIPSGVSLLVGKFREQ